jgi:hypothetical protein
MTGCPSLSNNLSGGTRLNKNRNSKLSDPLPIFILQFGEYIHRSVQEKKTAVRNTVLTTDIDCIPAYVEMIGMERFSGESLQNARFAIDIRLNFDGNQNESDESGVRSHQNSQ